MADKTSFLPEDYLQKRIDRRTNVICIVLFVIVLTSLVGVYVVKGRTSAEVAQTEARVNERIQEAAERLKQLEKLQARKRRMIQKARVTSALMERVPRSTLLAELINHMPESLSLLELNLKTKARSNSARPSTAMERRRLEGSREDSFKVEVKPKRITFNLVGVAPTDVEVSKYMTALGAYKLFADVSLEYSEETTIDKQRMRKFQVHVKVADDVTVGDIKPTKIARDLEKNPMDEKMELSGDSRVPIEKTAAPAEDD